MSVEDDITNSHVHLKHGVYPNKSEHNDYLLKEIIVSDDIAIHVTCYQFHTYVFVIDKRNPPTKNPIYSFVYHIIDGDAK